MNHQKSLIQYWDLKNVSDTYFEEGKIIGLEKGEKIGIEKNKKEIANGMVAENLPLELIVKLTGLTPAEIENVEFGS